MPDNVRSSVILEDGCIFAVETLGPSDGLHQNAALVVNGVILEKANALLPIAQAMAKARANRVSFFRATDKSLALENSSTYLRAHKAAQQAQHFVSVLSLLSQGLCCDDCLVVTVVMWREILEFFKQDASTGSIPAIEG